MKSDVRKGIGVGLVCLMAIVARAASTGTGDVNQLHLSACDLCDNGKYEAAISLWRDIWPQTVDEGGELRYKVAYNIPRAYIKWFQSCNENRSVITSENIIRCESYLVRAQQVEKTNYKFRKVILDTTPSLRKENMDFCRKFAEQGDSDMQYALGVMYGHRSNYVNAVEWARKAAEQGNAKAQSYLGMMYMGGFGVKKNYGKALGFYRKAAEQGVADGQSGLAYLFFNGLGVNKDSAEAVKWWHKAADQGNAEGENMLGFCYSNGIGVEKDPVEAVKWFRKAAVNREAKENLQAVAQYNTGCCYLEGGGVAKDEEMAMLWFRKAAVRGHVKAQKVIEERQKHSESLDSSSNDSDMSREYSVSNPYEMPVPLGMFRGIGTTVMSPCNIFMAWPASFELGSDIWLGLLPAGGTVVSLCYIVKDLFVGVADVATLGWTGNKIYDEDTSPWWWQRFGGKTKAEILK